MADPKIPRGGVIQGVMRDVPGVLLGGAAGSGGVGGAGALGGNGDEGGSAATSSAGSGGQGGVGGTTNEPEPLRCFFSDYVEGSKSLKALAVTCTERAVLDQCHIDVYANGAAKPRRNVTLAGTLEPATSLVICSEELAASSASCTQTAQLTFNGNDAITLVCGDVIIDAFGQIENDPGDAGWGTAPATTTDMSWSRNCSVSSGDMDPSDAFEPTREWSPLGADDTSGLDAHCSAEPDSE